MTLRTNVLAVAMTSSIVASNASAEANYADQPSPVSKAALAAKLSLVAIVDELKRVDPSSECLRYEVRFRTDIRVAPSCSSEIGSKSMLFGKTASLIRYAVPRPLSGSKPAFLEVSFALDAKPEEAIDFFAQSLRQLPCVRGRYDCSYRLPGDILVTLGVAYPEYTSVRIEYRNPKWQPNPDCC